MTSVPELCEVAQRVFNEGCDRAAQSLGYAKRRSKIHPRLLVQTLVFGWLSKPEATLEGLSQMSAALGVRVSAQAIDQRFRIGTAAFLLVVLKEMVWEKVSAEPVAIELLDRFTEVSIVDSSQVVLPPELAEIWRGNGRRRVSEAGASKEGAGAPGTLKEDGETPKGDPNPGKEDRTQSSVKIHLRLELRQGTVKGLELTDGREHDRNADLVAQTRSRESLESRDRGYFRLDQMARETQEDRFWITRFQANTGFIDAEGRAWEIGAFLLTRSAAASPAAAFDVPIFLGLDHRIPSRLIGVPAPIEGAEARRRSLRREARTHGHTPSKEQLALCDWNVWVTNVPAERLSIPEVVVLARVRWQIELMFKLWKSDLRIDEWRTRKKERILCELYSKLIAALLQHWLLVVCAWSDPDRSLRKAAQTLRQFALSLAINLPNTECFCHTLSRLITCFASGCRLNKRKKHPSSAQLLLQPDLLT